MTEYQVGFFRGRNSGGKVNALKETSSTSNSNEALNTHKSEKTFPSFLRNNLKSPEKLKSAAREGMAR